MIKALKSQAGRLILKLSGRVKHLKEGIKCNRKWYGNNYGGFYVCPDLLKENSIVYSIGIGRDVSFDKEIIKNHNCNVFGFDPTPQTVRWVEKTNLPSKFKFFDFGISDKSGFVDFHFPKNPGHISGSMVVHKNVGSEKTTVRMKTVGDIAKELGHDHIDVLKMDIEGAEYDVIENILKESVTIGQILIEFHDRYIENGVSRAREAIKKLQNKGYEIFAVSNTFQEVSFINKNFITAQ